MKTIFKIIGALVVVFAVVALGNKVTQHQVSSLPAQQQKDHDTPTAQIGGKNDKEITLHDVSYGPDKRNTMNILVPKGASYATPFILFIHGGGWVSGDKKDVAVVQTALAAQGIASATMNYRYASNSVHYDDLMQDVTMAVRYVKDHGPEWNVGNTDGIVIGGISAGAHMAMLYAYQYDYDGYINAVISMAGPSDLTNIPLLDASVKNKLVNGVEYLVDADYISGKPLDPKFAKASPIKATRRFVPTLFIHGTADAIVMYDQSISMDALLAEKGIEHLLVSIPGANHDLGLLNPLNAKKIGEASVAWVKKYRN